MPQIETSNTVSILTRITLFAGLWWIIAQGQTDAWLIGLPAVALAAMARISLSNNALPRLSIIGLFRFITLFITESISGGIDVARRTLTPELRVQPGFSQYRLTLGDPRARVLFVNCISLLPGTLSASFDDDCVEIHQLDMRQNPVPQLQRIERAVAELFRLRLENMNA